MDRRTRLAVIGAIVAMVVLVLAASSGPLDVWRTPTSDGDVPTLTTDPPQEIRPQEPQDEGRRDVPGWIGTLSKAIGVVAALAALVGALAMLRLLRMPRFVRTARLRRREAGSGVLPEVEDGAVTVDVVAARTALLGGTPRNAIVACWMQLERDAAAAGLGRLPADTPTEYVERVIGGSSVDPEPIRDLAALYREARFSRHDLSDAHRTHALDALERVERALVVRVGVADAADAGGAA